MKEFYINVDIYIKKNYFFLKTIFVIKKNIYLNNLKKSGDITKGLQHYEEYLIPKRNS